MAGRDSHQVVAGLERDVADLLGRRVEPIQHDGRSRMELQRVDPAGAGRLSGDERRDKLVGHGVPFEDAGY